MGHTISTNTMTSRPQQLAMPLILINGYPAVGKATLAEHLQSRLASNGIKSIIFEFIDNSNSATQDKAIAGQDELTTQQMFVAESILREPDNGGQVLICTDFITEGSPSRARAFMYQHLAVRYNRPFVPVRLACCIFDNGVRLDQANRSRGLESTIAGTIYDTVIKNQAWRLVEGGTNHQLEVNLSQLPPSWAARKIKRFAEEVYETENQSFMSDPVAWCEQAAANLSRFVGGTQGELGRTADVPASSSTPPPNHHCAWCRMAQLYVELGVY